MGDPDYGSISYLTGQRASACTCPGEDHPGPSTNVGRSGPEIDVIEAQVDYHGYGTASQSLQIAPFDPNYRWLNDSSGMTIYDADLTTLNQWSGSINQESVSAVTKLDNVSYNGVAYQTFGYELSPGPDGFVTWYVNGKPTWQIRGAAFPPSPVTEIGQRTISEEPMYIILNLGLSDKFQSVAFDRLVFPAIMRIDYVRVYQTKGGSITCDPPSHPTTDYIQNHLVAYTNPNATTWAQAGYTKPKSSFPNGC